MIARVFQVNLAVITALRFISCAFGSVENNFGFDENSTINEGILMYLPPAVVAENDDLFLLNIVRRIQFDAATSKIVFERLQNLD